MSAERPKISNSKVSILRPQKTPRANADLQKISGDEFREALEQTGARYEWVAGPCDTAFAWLICGIFTTRDLNPAAGNRVWSRLRLLDADDDVIGTIDLSPTAAVKLARTLLEFAISSATLSGEHVVIADRVTALLEHFLSPAKFQQFRDSLTIAARESIRAELLVEDALAAKHR